MKKINKGFSIIEALLSMALFVLFVAALTTTLVYVRSTSLVAGKRDRAAFLAQEGLEAVRNIRDSAVAFANIPVDGNYGIAVSGNQWTFSGSSDTTDGFQRVVNVATVDSKTKKITSTVTWEQFAGRNGSLDETTYLTNWAASTIGNWGTITLAGSYDLTGNGDANKLQVVGNYVYEVRSTNNPPFSIFDVSTPATPALVGTSSITTPINIAMSGNYAYISATTNNKELYVYDVSTPASPTEIGSYNATGNADASGIYVDGNYAYLTRLSSGDPEFYILNISTPATPTLSGSLDLGASGFEVYVNGNYAYVASGIDSQELQVINITNKAAPTLIGGYNLTGNQDALTVIGAGNYVYLGRADGYVYDFDVTTPGSPLLVGSFNAGTAVNDLALGNSNNYLFCATSNTTAEFRVLNVTAPATPTSVGIYNATGLYYGVAYSATLDRAFLAGADNARELTVLAPN